MSCRIALLLTFLAAIFNGSTSGSLYAQERERSGSERRSQSSRFEKSQSIVREAFRDVIAGAAPAVVRIFTEDQAVALGAVVDSNGMVVTKASLLKDELSCRLSDGRVVDATVIGVDEESDLALLRVRAVNLTPIVWRREKPPSAGSWVATVGHDELPVAVGVVSVEPRKIRGFSRPGRPRGFLGVQLDQSSAGPRITLVTNGSAAAKAGLRPGDVISKIDGVAMRSIQQTVSTIGSNAPGDSVKLNIRRGDRELEIDAKLGRNRDAERPREDRWGGGPFSERRGGFPLALPHDSVLRPKDCGGPLVDLDGHAIGINIARALRVTTYTLPAELVQSVITRLVKTIRPVDMVRAMRVEARGIPGTLLISGAAVPPDQALDTFVKFAGGDRARIAILGQETAGGSVEELRRQLRERHQLEVTMVSTSALESLGEMTAVWIASPMDAVGKKDLAAVLDRGGALGGVVEAAGLLATIDLTTGEQRDGWNFFPAAAMATSGQDSLEAAVDRFPWLVGYRLARDGAVLVHRRRVHAFGASGVDIYLAPATGRPARLLTLESGKRADLTALRRAALVRGGAVFPSAEPRIPEVNKGALVIAGGGRLPAEILQKFIALAGGPDALIVVLPTAMPDPLPRLIGDVNMFRKAGARQVVALRARSIEEVESPEFLDTLRRAGGLWFGGGRQWRFVDAYAGTRAHAQMKKVLERGGVIGGSSAGASIQAEYLARGDPLGNRDIMAPGYEQGLGFLPGVAIDQHFSQRQRHRDMSALVDTYPQLLGIGIDESTALIVHGHVAEVYGKNAVSFYDRTMPVIPGERDHELVAGGSKYDLEKRVVVGKRRRKVARF